MIVKANKFRGHLDDELKQLRREFTVDINEEFFKSGPGMTGAQQQPNVTRLSIDDLPIKKMKDTKTPNEDKPEQSSSQSVAV